MTIKLRSQSVTYSTIRFAFAISLFFSFSLTFAQSEADKKSAVKIDSSKPLIVEYKTKIWNHSGSVADTGIILFRDSLSGKIARVEVTETESNSDQFQGQYMIS